MRIISKLYPPPSLLAKKILCPAFLPAPFDTKNTLAFQGRHAATAMKVIGRHLRMGYKLRSVEKQGNGFRIDLIFDTPSGERRLVEVKSAKEINTLHRLQAALYYSREFNEVVVSNRETDVVLNQDFIIEANNRAENVRMLLMDDPKKASTTYLPHRSLCKNCSNDSCPFFGMREDSLDQCSYQATWDDLLR